MAFYSFLSQSRKLFFAKHTSLHICVGNKACDLDSIVSAVTLAYYFFLTKKDEKEKGKSFVGIIPVPLEEFRLRYDLLRK
jgi:inorganic pyrophosphatase/exopolyphosphatase